MSTATLDAVHTERKLHGPHEIHAGLLARGLGNLDSADMARMFEGMVSPDSQQAVVAAQADLRARMAEDHSLIRIDDQRVLTTLHERGGRELYNGGGVEIDPSADVPRVLAWSTALGASLLASCPEERMCRHIRAAGARAMEIRSVAHVGCGWWSCLECLSEFTHRRQQWPGQCDLCGERSESFYSLRVILAGVVWTGDTCEHCHDFWNDSPAAQMIPPEEIPARALRARVGRNDPCPCGSGMKFKRCHGW